MTVYYDVGGVPSAAAQDTASELGSASTLQAFQQLLQQAGASLAWSWQSCTCLSEQEGCSDCITFESHKRGRHSR